MMENLAVEMMVVSAIERAGRALAATMQPRQAPDELLRVQDVARTLSVSVNYANMLVQQGIIPGLRMNGMKVRRRALEEWMAAMEGKDLTDPAHPVPLQRREAV